MKYGTRWILSFKYKNMLSNFSAYIFDIGDPIHT